MTCNKLCCSVSFLYWNILSDTESLSHVQPWQNESQRNGRFWPVPVIGITENYTWRVAAYYAAPALRLWLLLIAGVGQQQLLRQLKYLYLSSMYPETGTSNTLYSLSLVLILTTPSILPGTTFSGIKINVS